MLTHTSPGTLILRVFRFLLVKLHMTALSELDDPGNIFSTLAKLPKKLEKSYSSVMDRIREKPEEKRTQAMAILSWMSYLFRDLHVSELCAALTCHKKMKFNETIITSVCCGLVIVEDQIVRFVHYSAQKFFKGNKDACLRGAIDQDSFHLEISRCCIEYLSISAREQSNKFRGDDMDFCSADSNELRQLDESSEWEESSTLSDCIDSGHSSYSDKSSILGDSSDSNEPSESDESIDIDDLSAPFAKYAAEFLHQHLDLVPPAANFDPVKASLFNLVDDTCKRQFYYAFLRKVKCYPIKSRWLDCGRGEFNRGTPIRPLHLAVFVGFSDLIDDCIRLGQDVNALDAYKQSPLIIALKRKLTNVVVTLLNEGATVDLATWDGHVVLLHAAQHDFDHVTEMILDGLPTSHTDSSLNDLGVLLGLPLVLLIALLNVMISIWKSPTKSPEAATTPSSQDIGPCDVGSQDEIPAYYGKLVACAYHGKSERLKDLLGADQRMASWRGMCDDNRDLARYVKVDYDSDVTNGSESSESSLNSEDIVGIYGLYGAGPTGKAATHLYFLITACFMAVERKHNDILDVFLRSGIDPDLKNHEGQPLLHRAVFRNDAVAVQKLLKKRATVDLTDENGRTALTAHAHKIQPAGRRRVPVLEVETPSKC